MTALEKLQKEFKPSRDHADIHANKALIRAAIDEANAALKVAYALSEANRSMCDHKDARWYSDYGGGSDMSCPHCG